MADTSIAERYFTALCSADGNLASSLFAEDGVLDDYRGGHHAGREEIREFISTRPLRTLRMLGPVYASGPRLTVYVQRGYEDGSSRTVRFVFTRTGELIQHLCNSLIEFVPEQFLSDTVDSADFPRPGCTKP